MIIRKPTWNLKPLFSSDDDPTIGKQRQLVEKAINLFIEKWNKRKDYITNALILKKALDDYELLMRDFGFDGKEGYYFWLRTMQDQTDQNLKAKFAKVLDFSNKNRNNLQFFELNLAKVSKDKQKEFLKNPELKEYKHFLEKIFKQAAYVLTDAEEKIINLKDDPAYQKWTQLVSSLLSKEEKTILLETGKKQKCNFEQILSLTNSTKKAVRDEAAKAFNEILQKYVEIAEAEMNAILANKKVDDELREMPRPDFSRHLADDVDSDMIDTLIATVAKRNDIAQRFYKLKTKLLRVKKLQYHERNIEYASVDKKYTFEEGANLVNKVFISLDKEFSEIFTRFLKNGQLDIYPRKGKRGGAFCSYWLISQPTYVLLNHDDKLRDVLTIAHELGHGINNELMKKSQHALNFGTPLATAETASTFMEDFVLQEILKTADEETRFGLMLTKLNSDISTIFRQVACYQFEQELHNKFREKGYLSYQEIGIIFQQYMSAYMGSSVEQSKGSENWWVYWSHIRTFFYVYSYSSGLLISKALQNGVKENPDYIIKVKDFLSAGQSASPKVIFENLGIDITDAAFWNKGLDEVELLLKETEKLAKKLEKIS